MNATNSSALFSAPSVPTNSNSTSMMWMVAKAAATRGRLRACGGIQALPWLRLVIMPLVLILGLVLGHVARWFADGMVVNAQLYFHAFRLHSVRTPWVYAPLHFLSAAVLQYSALTGWAVALGYVSARTLVNHRASATAAGFIVCALLGTSATTTSVRVAQPWFFEGMVAAIAYPLGVKLLFLAAPAYLAARAVRRQSTSFASMATIGVIGVVLAGWSAADLGHGLTYGCVVQASTGPRYCTSREGISSLAVALALAAASTLMAWDSWVSNTPGEAGNEGHRCGV